MIPTGIVSLLFEVGYFVIQIINPGFESLFPVVMRAAVPVFDPEPAAFFSFSSLIIYRILSTSDLFSMPI